MRLILETLCGNSCSNLIWVGDDHGSVKEHSSLYLWFFKAASLGSSSEVKHLLITPKALGLIPTTALTKGNNSILLDLRNGILSWWLIWNGAEQRKIFPCFQNFLLKLFWANLSTGVWFCRQIAAIKVSTAISLIAGGGRLFSASAAWVRRNIWDSVQTALMQSDSWCDWENGIEWHFSGYKKLVWNRSLQRTVVETHCPHTG